MPEYDMDPHVERAIEAFNDLDPDGLVAEFAEGGTFLDPLLEDEVTGVELREYCVDIFEAFPDIHLEPERVLTTDGITAIELTYSGTHEGPFEGIPPTGKTVAVPAVAIITVSDDGITSWRDYFDQQTFTEQLGLAFPAIIGQLPKLAWGKLRAAL